MEEAINVVGRLAIVYSSLAVYRSRLSSLRELVQSKRFRVKRKTTFQSRMPVSDGHVLASASLVKSVANV